MTRVSNTVPWYSTLPPRIQQGGECANGYALVMRERTTPQHQPNADHHLASSASLRPLHCAGHSQMRVPFGLFIRDPPFLGRDVLFPSMIRLMSSVCAFPCSERFLRAHVSTPSVCTDFRPAERWQRTQQFADGNREGDKSGWAATPFFYVTTTVEREGVREVVGLGRREGRKSTEVALVKLDVLLVRRDRQLEAVQVVCKL